MDCVCDCLLSPTVPKGGLDIVIDWERVCQTSGSLLTTKKRV